MWKFSNIKSTRIDHDRNLWIVRVTSVKLTLASRATTRKRFNNDIRIRRKEKVFSWKKRDLSTIKFTSNSNSIDDDFENDQVRSLDVKHQ